MSEEVKQYFKCCICQELYWITKGQKLTNHFSMNNVSYGSVCNNCTDGLKHKKFDIEHFYYIFKKQQEAIDYVKKYVQRININDNISLNYFEYNNGEVKNTTIKN